jgi:hypothetical protein
MVIIGHLGKSRLKQIQACQSREEVRPSAAKRAEELPARVSM